MKKNQQHPFPSLCTSGTTLPESYLLPVYPLISNYLQQSLNIYVTPIPLLALHS